MTQRTAAKISGIGSIFVGLVVLFFYFRGILPLTDVYVAKREFGYYLVYAVAAAAGVLLLAAAIKRKKPGLWIGAGLLLLGIPLFFYAVGRLPFDYAPIRLRMVGRGLIPAAFLFLGIFALRGFRWVQGILLAVFSALGLYHLFLAVRSIAGAGDAFSAVKADDIVVALAIAAVSLFLAWACLKALGRKA